MKKKKKDYMRELRTGREPPLRVFFKGLKSINDRGNIRVASCGSVNTRYSNSLD